MSRQDAEYNLQATVNCIDSLTQYERQLVEIDKFSKTALAALGQTHKDQNYKTFVDFYIPHWKRIESYTKEIGLFRTFLIEEKKIIEDYINAGEIK